MLTVERLKEVLIYYPDVGMFERHSKNNNKLFYGTSDGRVYSIQVDNIKYKAHRLAWLYMKGQFPTLFIDHINGNAFDNRIVNLREATNSQNQCNKKMMSNNKSGLKGVCYYPATKKWVAYGCVNKQRKNLGYYHTKEEAHEVYKTYAKNAHGDFYKELV